MPSTRLMIAIVLVCVAATGGGVISGLYSDMGFSSPSGERGVP
jgi:hypothetical protein